MAVTKIEEFNWGVYVLTSDGKQVINENDDFFCIASQKGDLVKIGRLLAGGRQLGLPNLSYEFLDGAMPLTEEEHEQQMEDLENGRASRFDVGSLLDDMRAYRAKNS